MGKAGLLDKLNIYGLKIQINCKYRKIEKELTFLLHQFIKNNLEDIHVKINLNEKCLPRAIGGDIFPHLAKKKFGEAMQGAFIIMADILF